MTPCQQLQIENIEVYCLIQAIKKAYGYDFSNYSQASFKRRIKAYMCKHQFQTISSLIPDLLYNQENLETFIHNITVSTTEFFRNHQYFTYLKQNIFPMLATYPYINIWVAGCASGEEAYSLAILLSEAFLLDRTTIYATDLSSESIQVAKNGIYPIEYLQQGHSHYQQSGGIRHLADYFLIQNDKIKITSELASQVKFIQHNLIVDQSIGTMNLILCRNVLIYFNLNTQKKVIDMLYSSLSSKSYLCLGENENLQLADEKDRFSKISDFNIYQVLT